MEITEQENKGCYVEILNSDTKPFKQNTVTMEANQGLKKIIDMVIDGSGIRDIGRVLKISPNAVTAVLKNRKICKTGE